MQPRMKGRINVKGCDGENSAHQNRHPQWPEQATAKRTKRTWVLRPLHEAVLLVCAKGTGPLVAPWRRLALASLKHLSIKVFETPLFAFSVENSTGIWVVAGIVGYARANY